MNQNRTSVLSSLSIPFSHIKPKLISYQNDYLFKSNFSALDLKCHHIPFSEYLWPMLLMKPIVSYCYKKKTIYDFRCYGGLATFQPNIAKSSME